jgi:predicted nucleic acid-binding protein
MRTALEARFASARAYTCPLVDLELLQTARGPAEYKQWAEVRRAAHVSLPLTPEIGDRALQVQRELARRGLHRSATIPGLLIAATAELNDVTMLHYDAGYVHIAGVTGQAVEWVLPNGTVD